MDGEVMEHSLRISPQEDIALAQKNLEKFWYSRLQKKDPVARIGYAIWVSDPEKLRTAIITGDTKYWNHKPFAY
jgi:hypothetical protein